MVCSHFFRIQRIIRNAETARNIVVPAKNSVSLAPLGGCSAVVAIVDFVVLVLISEVEVKLDEIAVVVLVLEVWIEKVAATEVGDVTRMEITAGLVLSGVTPSHPAKT